MLNLPAAFAGIASKVTTVTGAPFFDGYVSVPGTGGGYDDNGAYVPPSAPTQHPCKIQIDGADEYMKAVEGFADKEVQMIILSATIDVVLTSDVSLTVTDPRAPAMFQGAWLVASVTLDPAGIGYAGKGRRA